MKKAAVCFVVGLLLLSVVIPGLGRCRRVWDWESGLLSRRACVFARSYERCSYGSGGPSLRIGETITNAAKAVVEAVITGTDAAVDWAEKKVSEYGLGGVVSAFLPGPGYDLTFTEN